MRLAEVKAGNGLPSLLDMVQRQRDVRTSQPRYWPVATRAEKTKNKMKKTVNSCVQAISVLIFSKQHVRFMTIFYLINLKTASLLDFQLL